MPRPRRRPEDPEGQKFVDNMMYLLTASYMFYPPWDTVWEANDNKNTALLHRMAKHKEIFENEECTEFEAMLYISTVTLSHSVGHDWAEIYMYLFRRWSPEKAAEAEIEGPDTLTKYPQQEDLSRLRKWIFKTQMNRLKRQSADFDQAEVDAEAKELEDLNPRMF